jgi:uncharacterized membrane protein
MGSVSSRLTADGKADAAQRFRFGREAEEATGGDRSVVWLLKRNCSMSPRQLLGFYGVLSLLSLGIAGGFWVHGATLVMPFAWIEVLAVGLALWMYARHAADVERINLRGGQLTVELAFGSRTDRVDFKPEWVRVEPEHGDGSLIELSGQGKRVVIGRFVRPEMRRQLAEELRWALRRWPRSAA